MPLEPRLIVALKKESVPKHLNHAIVEICRQAIEARGVFTIALSGGSLPSFLASIVDAMPDDAQQLAASWHVILADERCVPSTDPDSNLKALKEELFSVLKVPPDQIYGINESLLSADGVDAVASDYEATVKNVLSKSGGQLDLAVLGFGPDGHTCSLFPKHPLLKENQKWVAGITDSPKPPPSRITLTLVVLNQMTRHVIICGAGASKGPILRNVFLSLDPNTDTPYPIQGGALYKITLENNYEEVAPDQYPCGMIVSPTMSLTWITDAEAMGEAQSAASPY